jgi:hypothetical protein
MIRREAFRDLEIMPVQEGGTCTYLQQIRSGVSGAINDLDPTDLGPTLKHVSDVT